MISWAAGDEEEVMELLWQNGQVVMKSQRSPRKSSPSPEDRPHPLDLIPAAALRGGSPPPYHHHHRDPSLQQQNDADNNNNNNLFIQEDEMSTWLLSDFCSDLLLPATPAATSAVSSRPFRPPPAVPPPKRLDSFSHFSRLNRPRATPADEATVVDSSDTPMVARTSDNAARVGAEHAAAVVLDAATRDRIATSSPGASSASAEPIPPAKSQEVSPSKTEVDVPDLRRRKARDGEQSNDGEDVELLSSDAKRILRSSSSTKRSRDAEVHNLSERRRRDRINEKMRALQELIPHCNKADKASMLDEAIGYLKSLQMQVQMMSTGCGMMPMMYPGMQHYMPRMGMGMNMPMIHFPNVFSGSTLPTTAARPHMNPGFRFPAFQMPSHIPAPDLSRMPPTNHANAMLSSSSLHNSNSPRMPGFMDPYQQYFALQHMHLPFQQSQANTSSSGKPTTSKAGGTSRKGLTVPSILQKSRLRKPEFCSVEISRGFESERAEGKPSGCVVPLLLP